MCSGPFGRWCDYIKALLFHLASNISIHQIIHFAAVWSKVSITILSFFSPWFLIKRQICSLYSWCIRYCVVYVCVNVNAMNRIPMTQQQEIIFICLQPWEDPPSYLPSSLPSPPFLLTCAVRGEINLSDGLCDPPPGLGRRRSTVTINTLPGFSADMNFPRPPLVFIHDQEETITFSLILLCPSRMGDMDLNLTRFSVNNKVTTGRFLNCYWVNASVPAQNENLTNTIKFSFFK